MEIECPYCGTAHLLDLGNNRSAVLIKLHCLMCGGRLQLPPLRPFMRQAQQPYYPPHSGGVDPITLHAIRSRDAGHWVPTGSVYDNRLGTWVPPTGSPSDWETPKTLRAIIRKSIGLSEGIQKASGTNPSRYGDNDIADV